MLGLPSHSPRGADGQRGFPGQEVHLPPGVPQTVCSAVFFCEERSTYERLLYLKHLPTHAAPTRRGCDSCLLRIRGSPRTDFGHTEIDPEGRDGGPRVLWRKELRTLQQQVLSFSDHS